MKVKAKASFNHDGKNHHVGEEFEVSDQLAKELTAKGLVEESDGGGDNDSRDQLEGREAGEKGAPTPQNKMAPEHQGKSPGDVVGGVGGTLGTPASESPKVTPKK
jgi:hypothetical protein